MATPVSMDKSTFLGRWIRFRDAGLDSGTCFNTAADVDTISVLLAKAPAVKRAHGGLCRNSVPQPVGHRK
jgi:hypothetical protein